MLAHGRSLPAVRTADLDYDLPDELVAQVPVEPRDSARLLVDRGSVAPEDRTVRDLPSLLRPGDLLVVNDTKVLPARLRLVRASGGAAEVLLLDPLDGARRRWEALLRPGKRLRSGERLRTTSGEEIVEVHGRLPSGDTFEVELLGPTAGLDALEVLDAHGEMPLPPYIHERLADRDRYQTVYAREPGSAAAPTAGLHFTPGLLEELAAADIGLARVELVVGLDTFQPIATDDPLTHPMHSERYRVPAETIAACERAERVVAVGTTSVRALESAARTGELEGRTTLFVSPGFEWRVVDVLMTNFHLPRTTLLLMVEAFVGERWRRLYQHAIERRYRFLSFGDAMLLDRSAS
jgi:S-adenosylmethionine:tRNA ribosyltransferase-isomerase